MTKRWPIVLSFVLFILLCISATYWALHLFQPPARPVAAPPPSAAQAIDTQAAAGLFGGGVTGEVASNFRLVGVIQAGSAADSIAIVSADSKPAQAVRVGAEIMPGVKVREVHRTYVVLSEDGVDKRIVLPEKAPPGVASEPPVPGRPVTSTSTLSRPSTMPNIPAPMQQPVPSAVQGQSTPEQQQGQGTNGQQGQVVPNQPSAQSQVDEQDAAQQAQAINQGELGQAKARMGSGTLGLRNNGQQNSTGDGNEGGVIADPINGGVVNQGGGVSEFISQ